MFNSDRKFWGWGVNGYQFPQPMIQMASALMAARFGMKPGQAQATPNLESIKLPASNLVIPDHFSSLLTTDAYHRAVHTYGKSFRDVVRGTRSHYQAVISLDLCHLNQVLEIDRNSRAVRVQDLPQHRASCTVQFEHFSQGAAACRALHALDPKGIMNPGTLLQQNNNQTKRFSP